MPDLYLASKSPRRRELLEQIGVSYEVLHGRVEEIRSGTESPEDYVCRLARQKSEAGMQLCREEGKKSLPVLGADTLIQFQGQVFEKPKDMGHGVEMLLALSAHEHQVLSAVAVTSALGQDFRLSVTRVRFRKISEQEAVHYWHTGEPADKAGGYGIQGFGSVFVENINGSYSGVVGLPLAETYQLLEQHRVPCWNTLPEVTVPKELDHE